MRQTFRQIVFGVCTICAPVWVQAQTAPITLDFLPPQMEPRDICGPGGAAPETRLEIAGDTPELTDIDRVRFLRRDIRQYTDEDAAGFSEFIDALIARRAALDEGFGPVDAEFARIDLWLRAGRLDALQEAGLVADLRDRIDALSNNQRVQLARFYQDGVGVDRDLAFAQELIREAAYGGNANALLEIAQLAQAGTLVEGWDAPLDLTVTMAFGGILGALDSGVCRRAERIAQAYVEGDVVTANPTLALAWFKFAADMGRGQSAWRVVEHHLNAPAERQDNIEMQRYLRQAVRLGVALSATQTSAVVSSGAVTRQELDEILGHNYAQDDGRTPHSVGALLQLGTTLPDITPGGASLYTEYLREIVQMPQAPGRVFDQLGRELMVSEGRWKAEPEAMALFEEAAARGDGPGTRQLAQMILRYRDDPAQVARAESLLMEAISRHGMAEGMRDLDRLYRCQVNDAPRLTQADLWAQNYAASNHRSVQISATDLLALSPQRAPEAIARIQSLALGGRSVMAAAQAQRLQANPLAARAALEYWADQIEGSKQALETFVELELELAHTPAEREQAVELFRRIYLNNGVTTALDLAIALVEHDARDPKVAAEIETLLTIAANRGEGGALRLLSRLTTGAHSDADVYAQYAQTIEDRGDFLALMFALPHVARDKVDDYIDRAVSLMNCGTKDADELGDAYAQRDLPEQSFHWRQVGLHFEGGHVLSKLRLSNRQMALFDVGAAPDPAQTARRAYDEGDGSALVRLIELTANPALETYDEGAATGYILDAFQRNKGADLAAIVALMRAAPQGVQDAVAQATDITAALQGAAASGDVPSAFALGMILRDRAQTVADLQTSARWIEEAAVRGDVDAMFELGRILADGLGRPVDLTKAAEWMQQAADAGHQDASEQARLLRLRGTE